jgi:hypothetical protein
MKAKYFILLSILIFLPGYNIKKENSIEGTWKLVSIRDVSNDSLMQWENGSQQKKIIYKNHFMFVGKYIMGQDTSYSWGNGTYTLEGSNYREKIQVHSSHYLEGDEIPFEVTIRNDTLYQKGPIKTASKDYGWEWIEAYVRD